MFYDTILTRKSAAKDETAHENGVERSVEFQKFVRNLVAAGANHIAWIGFVVAHGWHKDIFYIAIDDRLLVVVVPLQIEVHAVFLHQIGDFEGLFQRHFAGRKGGIVVFEQVCVRENDAMAVVVAACGEQMAQPVELRSAERAIARVEADEKVFLRGRFHLEPIGGGVKIGFVVVPLVEIEVVVAKRGENGVVAGVLGAIELERRCEHMKRFRLVHAVAIDNAKIGGGVVAEGAHPFVEIVCGFLDMHIATDIKAVVIGRNDHSFVAILFVPSERLRHAFVGGVACGRYKSDPIDIASGERKRKSGVCQSFYHV